MTVKKAASKLKRNVVGDWHSTLGGLMLSGFAWGYYLVSRESELVTGLITFSGIITGVWLVFSPNTAIPFLVKLFTNTLTGIVDFALSRFTKKK